MRYFVICVMLSLITSIAFSANPNAPVVTNVHILGEALYNTTTAEGSILRAGYNYFDADGDPDGSLYQWFHDENSNGVFDVGDTDLGTNYSYTVTPANVSSGKEIFLEVIAKDDVSPASEELIGNTMLSTNSSVAVNSTYSNESQLAGNTYASGATEHFFNANWDGNIIINFGTTVHIHGDLTGLNSLNISIQNNSILIINGHFITGNNSVLRVVSGEMYVMSGMDASNSLTMTIDGTLKVDGNIELGNVADVDVVGYVGVTGDVITGTGDFIINDGEVNLGGVLDGVPPTLVGTGELNEWHPDPLPIELVYFKVMLVDSGVKLFWETASEKNNDHFIIYSSTDGVTFSEVASIPGAGNSQVLLKYSHIDYNQEYGVLYYKLRQIDYNGDYEEFQTISINNTHESEISINSDKEQKITIKVPEELLPVHITIYSSIGSSVIITHLNEPTSDIDISSLVKGSYFLNVDAGINSIVHRFVVE